MVDPEGQGLLQSIKPKHEPPSLFPPNIEEPSVRKYIDELLLNRNPPYEKWPFYSQYMKLISISSPNRRNWLDNAIKHIFYLVANDPMKYQFLLAEIERYGKMLTSHDIDERLPFRRETAYKMAVITLLKNKGKDYMSTLANQFSEKSEVYQVVSGLIYDLLGAGRLIENFEIGIPDPRSGGGKTITISPKIILIIILVLLIMIIFFQPQHFKTRFISKFY